VNAKRLKKVINSLKEKWMSTSKFPALAVEGQKNFPLSQQLLGSLSPKSS